MNRRQVLYCYYVHPFRTEVGLNAEGTHQTFNLEFGDLSSSSIEINILEYDN